MQGHDCSFLSHCEQEDSHLYRWEMNCGKHNIFYDFFLLFVVAFQ